MRILFDQGAHDMRNQGNNALLQVATQRFMRMWPDAECAVLTVAPHLSRYYFPELTPVDPVTLQPVISRLDRLHHWLPRALWRNAFEAREERWHRRMRQAPGNGPTSARPPHDGHDPGATSEACPPQETLDARRDAMAAFDLLVASGGGYFCDHDRRALYDLFDRFQLALAAGVPVVMVGQGIGPLHDDELVARARRILPHVDFVAYRNQRLGAPLLAQLSMPPQRTAMTGDDALELAYLAKPMDLGDGIGVSLRVAPYTGLGDADAVQLRTLLHAGARARNATLIAVPISGANHESDISQLRSIFQDYPVVDVSSRMLDAWPDAIARAGRCRVMVTGTYHGAIFALGQGVPVVGVAGSQEYFDKLAELADEFGPACHVLNVRDADFADDFSAAFDTAWHAGNVWRAGVLEQVQRLVRRQVAAYARIHVRINDIAMPAHESTGALKAPLSAPPITPGRVS